MIKNRRDLGEEFPEYEVFIRRKGERYIKVLLSTTLYLALRKPHTWDSLFAQLSRITWIYVAILFGV